MECIFCKIIAGEIPSHKVYEDKDVLAFKDINPIAPVHVLIIPKKHIESVNDLAEENEFLAGRMILVSKNIAKDLKTSEKGYKLLFRVGSYGGQEVPHVHLHLLGGAKLSEDIHPIKNNSE